MPPAQALHHICIYQPPVWSFPLCLACCEVCTALQGLAEDVVQSGSSGVTAEDQQASRSDMPAAADGSSLKDSEPAVSGSVKAEVVNEATPAHASAAEAQQPKGGATSGSRSAWFGRAGGLLNRWAVPVKVKKEPKSTHKHGIADVIDLT